MEKVIKDSDIYMYWNCLECDDDAIINPDWLQENGIPYCGYCDRDMEYIETKIDMGDYNTFSE